MSKLYKFIDENSADMEQELTKIVTDLKSQIKDNPDWYMEPGDEVPSIDIRLCIHISGGETGYTWALRSGLSDYDQWHAEYTAASCVDLDTVPSELLEDLINQIEE